MVNEKKKGGKRPDQQKGFNKHTPQKVVKVESPTEVEMKKCGLKKRLSSRESFRYGGDEVAIGCGGRVDRHI